MTKLLKSLPKFITLLLLASLTLFLTLNGLEVLSNWNTSFTGAVEKIQNSSVINNIIEQNKDIIYAKDTVNIRDSELIPDQISFNSIGIDVFLSPARQTDDGWFTRTFNAHYIPLNQDFQSQNKDYLIYTRNHWRAISNIEILKKDDTIELIDKNGARESFAITKISKEPYLENYVLPRSPKKQLMIMVENVQDNSYWAIEAQITSKYRN